MLSDLLRDRSPDAPTPCDELADALAGVDDGSSKLDRAQRRHVEQCLRCQAELAQYRKLGRAMRSLRDIQAIPPAGLADQVVTELAEAAERHVGRTALSGRRVAYLGGIAATAAGAGAAIVLVTRGRKGRFALAS